MDGKQHHRRKASHEVVKSERKPFCERRLGKCSMSKQKVTKFGSSVYLLVPLNWRKEHGIDSKSQVKVLEREDGSLSIIPLDGDSNAKN